MVEKSRHPSRSLHKGCYFDGHEREDVVYYRNEVFLPQWRQHQRRFVVFGVDGSWKPPSGLLEGEKPLVFITHDESTFNSNDGKQGWMIQGRQPLEPKGKGKGIMVSGFLTPGGRLRVPDHIPDSELLQDPQWVRWMANQYEMQSGFWSMARTTTGRVIRW